MYTDNRKLHPQYMATALAFANLMDCSITRRNGWLWITAPNQERWDQLNRKIDSCILPTRKTPCTTKSS